jgi:hypothetical protein
MAGERDDSKKEPTLEMRLAAIEDKLARLTVTEEEMAAYSKVAGLAAARGGAPSAPRANPVPADWVWIQNCWIYSCYIHPVVNDCILFQQSQASSGMGFARLGRG